MDVLPLYPNKNVRITKRSSNYIVICLKQEITPGAYSIIDVEKQTWYTIEICCIKFGYGNPGLWIASPDKKTLFYGNYFTKNGMGYLKRSFFTGDRDKVLVGILVKNATHKSGFIIKRLVVNKETTNIKNKNTNIILDTKIKEPITSYFENTLSYTNSVNKSNNVINMSNNNEIITNLNIDLSNDSSSTEYYKNMCNSSLEQLQELIKQTKEPIFENNSLELLDFEENKKVIDNLKSEFTVEKSLIDDIREKESKQINDNIKKSVNELVNNYSESINEEKDTDQELIYCIKKKYGNLKIKSNILKCSINKLQVWPISLGIPKEHVLTKVPIKTLDFFKYDINESFLNKYKNGDDFYKDLEKSRFILISTNNFGKDDPIYYEALARGCIPIFINELDKYTSPFIPKDVLKNIQKTKAVNLGCVEINKDSYSKINELAKNLMDYTKDFLTTESIVDYVIRVTDITVKNVLFLANAFEPGDFLLQQSLIHGFKIKLGSINVIDYPILSNMYKNIKCKSRYRIGIPYDNTLEELNVSRGRLEKRLENKEFDLIIVMGVFSDKDRIRLRLNKGDFPFKDIINEYYVSNEICFIDGNSTSSLKEIENRLGPYANKGICFCKDFI